VARLSLLLIVAAVALPAPRSSAGSCTLRGSAAQLVTVTAADPHATTALMRLWLRSGGCRQEVGGPWTVYIGFAGLSNDHHEGDGTTPIGSFGIAPVLYGVGANPGVHLAYHRLVCGDWWDEDPSSAGYNTFQHVPCGTNPPFAGSSEALWQSTRAYVHLAFLEYNTHPAVPGRGSAIFIHAELGHPTNGCISLPPSELVRLLRWLRPDRHPVVEIGVSATMAR
jgi:L,D-peptidoglycan transpeptidase YkuD (ErfK/YbiS/YcfS/YnhG family)